ncbi:Hypothetical predicted protein [Olea europaea subsp. europaea]|uniref:Uncharacterized protein n=1 Tax=Olea europaea subsp. europaea TaxID=158383 RepID=A0A8S0QSI4_OLEEU|nr:Hypothetical predicted protein [Olea europaea subsp. europaea]
MEGEGSGGNAKIPEKKNKILLILSRYNDIAKYFAVEKGYSGTKSSSQNNLLAEQNTTDSDGKATDFVGVMIGIAEQVYSMLLLNFFFREGKAFNILLLSWMYAYYCFDYKLNFSGLGLDERLDFFESNWPFFAGFGTDANKVITSQRKKWKGAGLGRIPIFVSADYLS